MLKKIPESIPPELVKFMMEMGEEDEILIAGANYPAASRGIKRICYVNATVQKMLADILELLPLSADVMPVTMCFEEGSRPEFFDEINEIALRYEECGRKQIIDRLDKYPFLNRAEKVYCAVITSDKRKNCEIILTKGAL